MSCEFNFQTPTVGKMEAVTVSVGWDAVLEKKKKGRGEAEKDRVKTCLCLKMEKPFWEVSEMRRKCHPNQSGGNYPLRRLKGNKVWLSFNLHNTNVFV